MPFFAHAAASAARSRTRPVSSGFALCSAASTVTLRERRAEIEALALILDDVAAGQRTRGAAQQILGQRHEVARTGVGLIQLEHRELGVVPRRHAFVAEHATELVHALETADDQALQIQLGRNAQVQIDVERVVMRDERPRRGTARYRLHHRRLDLREVERIEEAAHEPHELAATAKHLARLLAHDQVDVALAQLRFRVRDAVPLLGQRPQRLRQQPDLGRVERQLAGLRLDQLAARRDDVAQVPLLEFGVHGLREPVALQHELDLARAVLQLHEARAAHDALDHEAPRDAHLDRRGRERLRRVRLVRREQLGRERVAAKIVRIRVAGLAHTRELRAALRDQPILRFVAVRHCSSLLEPLLQALLQKVVEIAVEHRLRPC